MQPPLPWLLLEEIGGPQMILGGSTLRLQRAYNHPRTAEGAAIVAGRVRPERKLLILYSLVYFLLDSYGKFQNFPRGS